MKLHEMMGGSAADAEITAEITVKYGTSCGCTAETAAESHQLNINEYMEREFLYNCTYREYYMTSNFIGQMSDSDSLTDFAEIVDSLAYLLPTWKRLDVCLCEDWLGNFKHFNEYRTAYYPEHMLTLLSKNREDKSLEQLRFKTKDLLPALKKPHEPEYIVFMPIHSQNHTFGYAAFTYENGKSFILEERIHNWCDAVANGLRSLRQKLYRAQFDTSFVDDLINARLDKAKELLDTTNMRLQEIGEQCGFQNQFHFMRQFKAKTGMTALQYRNRK